MTVEPRAPERVARDDHAAARLVPACMGICMSGLVSGVLIAVNTGTTHGYVGRWLAAWGLALPVAIAGAYLFSPLALLMARGLVALTGRRW